MKRRKTWFFAAGAVAFAGLGTWALLRGQGDVQYRTAPVERGNIAYTISATGTPNAVVTVQVGSQVSGNVSALYADFNTRVKKNQVVARIDPQLFQARVDQERANLSAAQASVVNARANLQKNIAEVSAAEAAVADARANVLKAKSAMTDGKVKLDRRLVLVKEGVLSHEDGETAQATYDQAAAMYEAAEAQQRSAEENVKAANAQVEVARTQVSSAEAQVKQAQASLAQAELDLDHTFIRAPVDGVVVARHVDVGQTVAASLQAPTLFEIAEDLTQMQVDTNVSEADVGRVRVGQQATFTVDAYPGHVFHGQVTSIRKAPINVQNVVTYDVVIGVANLDLKLFPGMTANVKVLVEEKHGVLKIPNAALRYRPAEDRTVRRGARQTVWVLDPQGPREVPVTLGIGDGTYTEVTSGLKEGDRVIEASFGKNDAAAQRPAGGMRHGPGF